MIINPIYHFIRLKKGNINKLYIYLKERPVTLLEPTNSKPTKTHTRTVSSNQTTQTNKLSNIFYHKKQSEEINTPIKIINHIYLFYKIFFLNKE